MGLVDNIKILTGEKSIPGTSLPEQPQKKILIVEDEKPLSQVLADRFESEGFRVLVASNGQEGLDMTISQKPDIVLLDLLMPVMDGKVMLSKVREIPEFSELPIVVLTNEGDADNILYTKTYNKAVAFLIKSNVTLDEIVESVKLILR